MSRRIWALFFLFFFSLLLVSCASSQRKVVRTSVDSTIDLSGHWNDTDSRLVAEEMVKDVMERSWLTDFFNLHNAKPVVIVGTIRNKSSEHISTETFTKDLERELINGGKVRFVADKSARSELREEVESQQSFATQESAKKLASERGADFMLQGTISSVVDAIEGKKVVFYQVDMELVNLESSEKVWIGSKKIKKLVSQDKYKW